MSTFVLGFFSTCQVIGWEDITAEVSQLFVVVLVSGSHKLSRMAYDVE